jgi:hypothetical protein
MKSSSISDISNSWGFPSESCSTKSTIFRYGRESSGPTLVSSIATISSSTTWFFSLEIRRQSFSEICSDFSLKLVHAAALLGRLGMFGSSPFSDGELAASPPFAVAFSAGLDVFPLDHFGPEMRDAKPKIGT